MRRLTAVSLLLLAACGATTAQAQSLSLTYKSGDTYKYTIHSTANETIDAGAMTVPLKLDLTALETVKVNSVDSSGAADLSIDLSNVVVKSTTDQAMNTGPRKPLPTISMKVAADGHILSVNGSSLGGSPFTKFTGMGGGFISAVLPNTAVKPGDTWSKDFDQPDPVGTGTMHVTTTSKYLRDESLQAIKAAVIETTSKASVDMTIDMSSAIAAAGSGTTLPMLPNGVLQSMTIKGTMTSVVTSWVDPSGHRVMKSHKTGSTNATTTLNLAPGATIPGMSGPITIKGDETTDLSPA